MLPGEVRSTNCHDADTLTGRQYAFNKRDLHQARRRDRHADVGGDLALVERQKPAGRRDAVRTEPNELLGGGKEFVQQTLSLFAHDALRRGAAHDLVEDWERPGLGIPHIAGYTREPRLQHQDPDPGAVERLTPVSYARCCRHFTPPIRWPAPWPRA